MNGDDINDYIPSLLNPRVVRKGDGDFSLTQNSFVSRSSLSLRKSNGLKLKPKQRIHPINKENSQNVQNLISQCTVTKNLPKIKPAADRDSLGFSAIEDLQSEANHFDSCSLSLVDPVPAQTKLSNIPTPLISVSSHTELDQNVDSKSELTVIHNVTDRATISVSFGIDNCQSVDINSKKSAIQRVKFSQSNDNTLVDCEIVEGSQASTEESDLNENMNELLTPNSLKRSAVTVNLEIKKKKPSSTETAEDKVLILNTSAIEKISHVIVQPPNYKLVKGKILDKSKFKSDSKRNSVVGLKVNNGIVRDNLRQKSIHSFFPKRTNVLKLKVSEGRSLADPVCDVKARVNEDGDEEVMSRNSGIADAIKCDRNRKLPHKGTPRLENESSNKSTRVHSPRRDQCPSPQVKTSCSSPRGKSDCPSCHSPRKTVESIQFSLPPKSLSTKRSVSTRHIPHHKIVAGTHFAVDAFSYGEIPNVKHYFLTHFHSDHYSGLKKGFNKLLFCSKITADLCISRLGVAPKCIHMIKVDETIRIDNVEVTAVEANHCPGAIMLVFTLPNGKTLLHTGDFRASPIMESYPIFWNKDIHTIYLDTTYCNPRYDFPTQEQSLEMALYLLRQKKVALEKVGKKFSSVLIVCGTYTIGKEKFFLGMSRRVGCTVWACPEKDRVLQAVEGRSFGHAPPHSCQLHVVPMRDLTHEKLRSYLDSLKGAFSEIVAFKPSGWENGKSSSVERDMVTIHGIPYSEHSSFSELIRFVKYLEPKQVVPTVDISGGVRAVQKYFPCPLVHKEEIQCQSKVTDFFSIQNQQQVPAVT